LELWHREFQGKRSVAPLGGRAEVTADCDHHNPSKYF
jgi:hypothetical protein